ncbi:MAG: FecR family protein [Ginsengibacter sp.]
MKEEKDLILLTKYIVEEANDDEKKLIVKWISEDASHETLYVELKAAWHQSNYYENSNRIDVDRAYNLFRGKISKPKRKGFVLQFSKLRVAAFIALLLSAGALTLFILQKKNNNTPVFSQEIMVLKGHQKKIILNDGTTVWLNSASMLKVDDNYGKKNRNVYLEGEGYFEVVHHKNMVFTITTKDYTVRDIGTKFNIKAYIADSIFETAVMDGKISVEGRFAGNDKVSTIFLAKDAVLNVRHPLHQNAAGTSSVIRPPIVVVKNSPNIHTYNYWKDDMLVFDNLSFKDIAVQLERKYNVVIVINDDSLNNYHFSGSFNKVPDIENVLNIIQETTPISYQQTGDTVRIDLKENK